jgi:hypothetical protein
MDVYFFLQIRTKFIRDFYTEASFPFSERKRKIETGKDPFESPLYDESTVPEEPPFLDEWVNANESLDVLGQMSVSGKTMPRTIDKVFLPTKTKSKCLTPIH